MKHNYTKHQIIEAIKHWKSVLRMMDESKSPLLDEFAKTFGEDVVFGNNKIITSLDMAKDIYNIVNNIVFNKQLTPRLFTSVGIIDKLKFASYVVFQLKQNGKITFANKIIYGQNNTIAYPPSFEISELTFKLKMPFIYFASIVIHEMIHQYLVENKNELQKQEDAHQNNETYDPHDGEFKIMMNNLNKKHGLCIKPFVNLNALQSDFVQAINAVQQMQESINKNNIVFQDDNIAIEKTNDETIQIVHFF